jgi:hypothetical protein
MNYQLKLLKVTSTSGIERFIQATEAVGTGLAYNKTPTGNYTLARVACGRRLTDDEVADEQLARLWLEEIAPMTDWTKDVMNIQLDLWLKTPDICTLIQDALRRANDRYLEALVQAQA